MLIHLVDLTYLGPPGLLLLQNTCDLYSIDELKYVYKKAYNNALIKSHIKPKAKDD